MSKYAFVMFLTLVRAPLSILAAVLLVVNAFHPSPALLASAIGILAVSALTDLFDGKLARKWKVSSRLGALADPLTDKVFYAATLPAAAFIAMFNEDSSHAIMLLGLDIISILRDQWVSFLRSVGSEYGADVKANWSGKLRTIIGFPVIVIIHIQLGLEIFRRHVDSLEGVWIFPRELIFGLEIVLIAITLISAFSYTARYAPYLRKSAEH
jgi:Phosphatidylglycerophosphate synthase